MALNPAIALGVKPVELDSPLQQAAQVQQILGMRAALAEKEREAQGRAALQALGPNATPEQVIGIASQYAKPETVLSVAQASADRKQALEVRREAARSSLENASATLQLRREMLEQRRSEAEARLTDAREREKFNEWYKRSDLDLKRQQMELTAELKKLGLEAQTDRETTKKQQFQDTQVKQLGTALDRAGLPEGDATLRAVEEALAKTPNLSNYITGPGSMAPDWAVPDAVKEGRQAFQKLMNITLKNRSGAAVTIPEFERLKQEFALGNFKTPEQFKIGVQQARAVLARHYQGVAAGFGPDVMKQYNDNLRTYGGTPLLEIGNAAPAPQGAPAATGAVPKISSDAEYNALPPGSKFIGPDGKTRRKP